MRNLILLILLCFPVLNHSYAQSSYSVLKQQYSNLQIDSIQISSILSSNLVDQEAYVRNLLNDNEIDEADKLSLLNTIYAASMKKNYKAAIQLIEKMMVHYKPDDYLKCFLLEKLGDFYDRQNQSVKALENYLKALLILEDQNDFIPLANVYRKIGKINLSGENNQTAKDYFDKARAALGKESLNSKADSMLLRNLYSLRGLSERRLGLYNLAIKSFDSSINISKGYNDQFFMALDNGNKALAYKALGNYSKALPLLIKDYQISLENKVYGSAFNSGIFICDIMLEHDLTLDSVSVDSIYQSVVELKERFDYRNPVALSEFYLMSAKRAKKKNRPEEANRYFEEFINVDKKRDSLNQLNNLSRIQEKYLMEKEMSELELLQRTNELQSSHLNLRTAVLIIIGIALIVVLSYVFMLRKKNIKIDALNEMLEAQVSERTNKLIETNKELDTYLYRASHDIRRPIRTLMGLNKISMLSNNINEQRSLFMKVYDTALGMDNMLFKLQMAYELNRKHPSEEVDVRLLFDDCIRDFNRDIEHNNATVEADVKNNATNIVANSALLKIAIDNILENALLYNNDEEPKVKMTTDVGRYYFYIHIEDNGYGIDEKYHHDLFKAYFKISNKTQGSGLGLFLASRAVSFLAGEITVESVINEGSKFTIKIPVNPK